MMHRHDRPLTTSAAAVVALALLLTLLVVDPIPEYDPRDSTGRNVYRSAAP
ncbi:MAG TPA: hypothetical protein VMM13_19835 [Euzebya sp.]|nr:hypothetical protein [Euzebya sp.]